MKCVIIFVIIAVFSFKIETTAWYNTNVMRENGEKINENFD